MGHASWSYRNTWTRKSTDWPAFKKQKEAKRSGCAISQGCAAVEFTLRIWNRARRATFEPGDRPLAVERFRSRSATGSACRDCGLPHLVTWREPGRHTSEDGPCV